VYVDAFRNENKTVSRDSSEKQNKLSIGKEGKKSNRIFPRTDLQERTTIGDVSVKPELSDINAACRKRCRLGELNKAS